MAEKYKEKIPPVAATIVVLLAFGLVIARPATMGLGQAILAVTIFIVGLVPSVLYFLKPPPQRPTFPLMPLTGSFYGIFFGLSAFFVEALLRVDAAGGQILHAGNMISSEIPLEAQIAALIGVAMMLVFNASSHRMFSSRFPAFRFPAQFSPLVLYALAWMLVIAHAAFVLLPWVRAIPSIGQLLVPASYVGAGLLFALWRTNVLPAIAGRLGLLVGLPATVLVDATSRMMTPVLLLAIFIIVLEMRIRGRLRWQAVLIGVFLAAVTYPVVHVFRIQTTSHQSDGKTLGELMVAVKTVVARPDVWGDTSPFRGLAWRIGHVMTLGQVMEKTPQSVPFWNGETYKPLITSFIPRLIWPGKPEERVGATFGARYGYQQPHDTNSFNLPWLTEMYVNFGWIGVVVGMSAVGMFLGFLERFFCRPDSTLAESVVGGAIVLPLFHQDSNLSVMIGSLVPLTIVLWVLFAGVGWLARSRSAPFS